MVHDGAESAIAMPQDALINTCSQCASCILDRDFAEVVGRLVLGWQGLSSANTHPHLLSVARWVGTLMWLIRTLGSVAIEP